MNSTGRQGNLVAAPPMSRVDWAIARYNWYRACGLLGDSPQRTAEVATYQKSPDPPRAKPHLKWHPLSKPDDDVAASYQQPIATLERHRHSRRVEGAHPRTISTPDHTEKALKDDPRTWSRVDWAIARSNWYRACGLLDDSQPRTGEVATYQRSPNPPTSKPHIKWYPLSKPDDEVATTDQRSVTETPPQPSRRCCQRIEHARARAMLARYQAAKEEAAKGAGPDRNFDPAKHPRADAGQPNGGQFIDSKTRVFRTGEGKHFVVSSDNKWRHKPTAGLHIPGLSHEQVENFLDLVEQGSALREEMSENDQKIAEAEDAIRSHGWNPFGSKAYLKTLKDKLAEFERDGVALQREWSKLEAEYKQAGFHEHEVTGYRSGANAEYQQDSTGGKGFKNAVRAYRKSQEEDLRGGQGVEPTYDEMAIISAPADAIAAFRLGAAVLRTGYQVTRQGGRYVIRKTIARQSPNVVRKAASVLGDDLASLASKIVGKPADREFREHMFDKIQQLGATIDRSKNAQKMLAKSRAEALTKAVIYPDGTRTVTTLFGQSPTRSALVEEYLHVLQYAKGGYYDSICNRNSSEMIKVLMEIDAKSELIRNAKNWRIPYEEIVETINSLAAYKKELELLKGGTK